MIGIWQAYADIYLIIAGVAILAAYGLPLVLAPMRWAKVFRWDLPQEKNLTVFLGRSLGLFLFIMAVFAFKAVTNPAYRPFFFDMLLWLLVFMLGLHAYGAVKKTQPITETMEILLWIILGLLTLCFYPV